MPNNNKPKLKVTLKPFNGESSNQEDTTISADVSQPTLHDGTKEKLEEHPGFPVNDLHG